MGTTMREPSFGEKAVGLTFNPSGDENVQKVKELYAEIIDLCDTIRKEFAVSEKGRLMSVAITEAQSARMWAVRAITYLPKHNTELYLAKDIKKIIVG